MATRAPSRANRIAVARPIPLPAPVMKVTLPASLGIDLSSTIANFKQPDARGLPCDSVALSTAGENAKADARPFDPALFADAAIDAETAKLNSDMTRCWPAS